jgi:hypothetical protein
METDEALRREVDRVPPVGLDEVLERADRRRARDRRRAAVLAVASAVAIIAGVAAVVALTDPDERDTVTAASATTTTEPTTTATTATPEPPLLNIEMTLGGIGPFSVDSLPMASGRGPDGGPALHHTLRLNNRSDAPVYVNDFGLSSGLGAPMALIVATEGCGYGVDPVTGVVSPGACRSSYEPHTIDPGQALDIEILVVFDRPGLADIDTFTSGTFVQPIEWRLDRPFTDIGDTDGPVTVGTIELRYFR